MDKQQYHDKALSLLNDKSTYAVLNSDPTSKTQRKLNKMLLDLKKAGKISDSTYKILYSSDGFGPRFYGLPQAILNFCLQRSVLVRIYFNVLWPCVCHATPYKRLEKQKNC